LLKLFEGSEKHVQVAWQFLEQSEKKAGMECVLRGFWISPELLIRKRLIGFEQGEEPQCDLRGLVLGCDSRFHVRSS
jgi:hypothetical protein